MRGGGDTGTTATDLALRGFATFRTAPFLTAVLAEATFFADFLTDVPAFARLTGALAFLAFAAGTFTLAAFAFAFARSLALAPDFALGRGVFILDSFF